MISVFKKLTVRKNAVETVWGFHKLWPQDNASKIEINLNHLYIMSRTGNWFFLKQWGTIKFLKNAHDLWSSNSLPAYLP